MTSSNGRGSRWQSSPGRVIAVACFGAAAVTSGIQGVAPAIPAIQGHFALSATQVALITSVYLFPSMFSALAAGMLADRIGVRPVLAAALILFGACGAVLLVEHHLAVLLAMRAVQGIAFGAVLSLSVSVIGGIAPAGPPAARAQGQRIIWMASAEAAFPAVAGLLLAVAWFAPFVLQLLSLVAGVLAWLLLPPVRSRRRVGAKAGAQVVVHTPAFLAVQLLAALRFIFKFAVLTYYPVLAVNEIGMSAVVLGFALGTSALLAALAAWFARRLATRWSSSQLIGGCLLAIVISMAGMAVADNAVLMITVLLLFGLQDGVFGVAHNVLVTEMAPADVQSTYVGLTATVRNVGKFTSPMLFGAVTLVLSISQSFLVLSGAGVASLCVARRVVRAQRKITTDGGRDESQDE